MRKISAKTSKAPRSFSLPTIYSIHSYTTTSLDLDNLYFHIPSNIISLPLAFVRSGYTSLNDGKLYYTGRDLYGWSQISRSTSGAYTLGVNPTEAYTSSINGRYLAFPLRCFFLSIKHYLGRGSGGGNRTNGKCCLMGR